LRYIQRTEGLALLVIVLYAYYRAHGNWLLFAILLFGVDISMLGYLKSPRLGAITYNLGHSAILPGLLVLSAYVNDWRIAFLLGLVWLAHVGMDRMLGYGLKYPDSFQHTHLGWIGKAKS